MAVYKRLFLSYLILIAFITGGFVVIERVTRLFPQGSYLVYLTIFIVLSISLFISYLLSRFCSHHIKGVLKGVR